MLLGLDVGTSSLKAALYAPDGRLVARAAQGYATHTPQRGWAEQHPEDWWQAACTCIRALLAQPGVRAQDIAGIGIAGQSWAAVLVDEDGHALCPTPLWMDTRAQAQCGQANRALGQQRIYQTGMNALHPSYTLPKLLWYRAHHPQLLKKTHRVLQSNGYLVSRLTGQYTQDVSQGYGFAFFDMRTLRWDESCAARLASRRMCCRTSCPPSGGGACNAAAAATGLLAGTPVVAGGLDAACGTLGAGVVDAIKRRSRAARPGHEHLPGQAHGRPAADHQPACGARALAAAGRHGGRGRAAVAATGVCAAGYRTPPDLTG